MTCSQSLIKQYEQASLTEKTKIINELIEYFKTTYNMLERNSIAFFFADYQITRAVPIIISAIKMPEYYNQIGSLIYALRCYPAIPTVFLIELIPIVANGTFEAAHESYLLVIDQKTKINKEETQKMCTLLRSYHAQGCVNDDLVLDMLDELTIS